MGDVVTVYDEGHPGGLWQLGKVDSLIRGADGAIRGVRVRVTSPKGQPKILNRPLQHIYPLEVRCEPIEGETGATNLTTQPLLPRRLVNSLYLGDLPGMLQLKLVTRFLAARFLGLVTD